MRRMTFVIIVVVQRFVEHRAQHYAVKKRIVVVQDHDCNSHFLSFVSVCWFSTLVIRRLCGLCPAATLVAHRPRARRLGPVPYRRVWLPELALAG